MKDKLVVAHQRLIDALANDILSADATDILSTHSAAEARVIADAMRQAIRRRLAVSPHPLRRPRDLPASPTMRPSRQEKKP